MQAHHGYEDGSGRFYITIDSQRCNGCEACVAVCPAQVLVMIEEDPMEQVLVAAVSDEHRRKIKESCAPCKPTGHDSPTLPCVAACESVAIQHSW